MPNISGVEVRVFSSAPIMNIASEIDKLNLSPDQYVVIGYGILNQLGIRKTDDLDFIVNTEMFINLRVSQAGSKKVGHKVSLHFKKVVTRLELTGEMIRTFILLKKYLITPRL